MAPEGVTTHATRVIVGEITPTGLAKMEEEIYRAADKMLELSVGVIAVGCTSGTFIKGAGYDSLLSGNIQKQTGIPSTTTSTAVIEALKIVGSRSVAVATPYTDEVNEQERMFLEKNGIRVTKIKGLGYSKTEIRYPLTSGPVSGIGLLEPYVAYQMGLDVDTDDADGIFISCTNFRTIEIIRALEQNRRKPVVTSNQATFWASLRMMGIRETIPGFGTLLEKY
jgi:maleate isomerase